MAIPLTFSYATTERLSTPRIDVSLFKLHPKQTQCYSEAHRFNVLECGRRFGKTTFGENLLIEPALDKWPVAWFAPTHKYMREPWDLAVETLKDVTKNVNSQEKRIELITGGIVDFWSLEVQDAGRGRKYKRIVVDEAGIAPYLQSWWTEAGRPTLTDLKGDAWFLGTPKGRGYFNKLFLKGQQPGTTWRSWRFGTIDNPYIDPTEIEEAREEYEALGLIHIFNQEYLGVPADDGGNPFGMAAIERCLRTTLSNRPAVAYGVDLAKYQDFTVVCGLDDEGGIAVLERWQSDWDQTTRRILDLVGHSDCAIDSTGVGDPIVEGLRRELGHSDDSETMIGYNFTSEKKQQLMEMLASAIQRDELGIYAGEREWLRHELESFEFELKTTGRVRYSAPSGLHDDGVMALALANWKLRQFAPTEFHSGGTRDVVTNVNRIMRNGSRESMASRLNRKIRMAA